MRQLFIVVLCFAAIGLIVGYALFGRVGGEYIGLAELLSPPRGLFDEVSQQLRGVSHARRNVLLAGGIGAVAGVVFFGIRRR